MPPKGKLPTEVVADFAKWIELGAPDSRDASAVAVKKIDFNAARKFWSFQPLSPTAPPAVANAGWAQTPIDAFILAKLEAAKLQPVRPADKRELIRRATFDLIGLPPTPGEVEGFLHDDSSDAFAKVVDRLLRSPHYGERWGRHWLDVARYAEDQAHTFAVKPYTEAYRYRDWVIAAFNEDLLFDQFVKYQLAADLMDLSEPERLKHLPALGFLGLGAQYYKNSDAAKAAADELDDRVDTVCRGFLGLTVSCARCHDHKFDPIPTQDYYSIAGVFSCTKLATLPLAPAAEAKRYDEFQKKLTDADEVVKKALRSERAAAAAPLAAQAAKYMFAVWQLQAKRLGDASWTPAQQAKVSEVDSVTLNRWVKFLDGNIKAAALDGWRKLPRPAKPADSDSAAACKVAEEFQKSLQTILAESAAATPNKQKADLLTALFGDKGIFPLPDEELRKKMPEPRRKEFDQMQADLKDLQKKAPPPLPQTHAVVENGSTDLHVYVRGNPAKPGEVAPRRFLHILAGEEPPAFKTGSGRRELAESITSSPLSVRVFVNRIWQEHFGRGLVGTASNFGHLGERPTHPELLDWLAARFLASGGSVKALHRDIMLSAVYQLSSDRDERNESVDADNRLLWRMNRRRLDVEAWRDAMLAVSGKLDQTMGGPTVDLSAGSNRRRTVYAKISRHNLDGLLRLFDFPDANITAERRTNTTVPQQQLFVLNSPFAVEQAKALAARVQAESADETGRAQRLFALAYGRPATAVEVEMAQQYLTAADPPAEKTAIKLTRWERLAQVVLESNEFLYAD
ncbi:MAG: DUF1549 and DUF1553 domain-containing protein, partial [Gemmataceae bacterium]